MLSSSERSNSRRDLRSAYNPITRQDVGDRTESPLFEGLESSSARTLGGVLFAVILILGKGLMQFSGLGLVILLVCVLYRMEPRERRIAAIPLAFSAVLTALGFASQLVTGSHQPTGVGVDNPTFAGSLYWMPLLFSAYLFYSPWKDSFTSRAIFWYSTALLLSGLLPGDGYLYVSALIFYMLFVTLAITLILDFSQGNQAAQRDERFAPQAPAAPVQPAPSAFS